MRARRIEPMARGQAERLLPLLEECLDETGLVWGDLDALAVCTGPGNFTGIRLSVAAARGLTLSTGLPAIGVSVFEAYAASRAGPVLALARNPRGAPHAQIFRDRKPVTGYLDGIDTLTDLPPDTFCVGHGAGEVAEALELALFAEMITPEPEWIGFAARARMNEVQERPAPLYLRPADAAPAAPAPAILDAS